jgi:hypothetical protein
MTISKLASSSTFDTEWRSGFLAQLRSLLPSQTYDHMQLLPFDEAIDALGHRGEEDLGMRDVPVSAIVGSVSRVGDFDRNFKPRNRCLRDRWVMVATAERDLPPVKLLQLDELFFVEDGHHRVSVSRANGSKSIRAHVRRIRTVVCASRSLTVSDLPTKAAERMFLERVPLPDDVRVGLSFDKPDDWRRLVVAVEAWGFRQTMSGKTIRDRCELADAWWADEVMPVIEELKRRGICTTDREIEAYFDELTKSEKEAHADR